MDKKKVVVVAAIIGVAMLSWLQTGGSVNNTHSSGDTGAGLVQSKNPTLPGKQASNQQTVTGGSIMPQFMANGQPSPFAAGEVVDAKVSQIAAIAPPEKEVIPPEEAARRKKMEALGYMVPPAYYNKNLATLRDMARQGDAYALVHLGEKYYFELNGQKANPEYDPAMDYPAAAKKSFSEALAVGNIRSAGIISELYLQENNAVDAYAWHLLSRRLGDSISAEWFEKTTTYANLSEQQKQQALAKLPDLVSNINSLSAKYKVRSIF